MLGVLKLQTLGAHAASGEHQEVFMSSVSGICPTGFADENHGFELE